MAGNKDECPKENQQLRKDVVWNRWVIFSPARDKRPSDLESKSPLDPNPNPNNRPQSCPFCSGQENECAPDVFRVSDPKKDPNWKIRVIQNLYPALSRHLEKQYLSSSSSGSGSAFDGFGIHDVVIETPDHSVQLSDLKAEEIGQVYKNHGAPAGASMSHSHSQILAMPFIPPNVSVRLQSMKDYFDQTKKCHLCEIDHQVQHKDLLIDSSTNCNFFSMVPFAASFPSEIWIVPRYHSAHFHELEHQKAILCEDTETTNEEPVQGILEWLDWPKTRKLESLLLSNAYRGGRKVADNLLHGPIAI